MYPWGRCWFAFEVRPGERDQTDRSEHWRALAHACRDADGKVNADEFNTWLQVMIDANEWGEA